jgi:DNA invertase Pin-like site-specific DNA recombinase
MLDDVENNLVSQVIVKDVSRLERWQAMVEYYIDLVFPKYDVEFISLAEDSEIIPLHNFMNELYAKDTSRKVRDVINHKGLAGGNLTSIVPYGYEKK